MSVTPGMEFVAEIGAQMARDAAYTTNTLLDMKDRQIKDLATTVMLFHTILSEAMVIDRHTEERLARLQGGVWSAQDTLDRMREQA